MKKIINGFIAIILLASLCFLGGEWPENTPRKKVITYDGYAIATVLICGLYLKREEKKNGRLR